MSRRLGEDEYPQQIGASLVLPGWQLVIGAALGVVLALGVTLAVVLRGDPPVRSRRVGARPQARVEPRPQEPPPPPAEPPFAEPQPPAARERRDERHAMVAQSIERPVDGRIAVRDPRVLEVFRTVPRHVFVPFEVTQHAYADRALPNYANRRVSQPYILARMIELLDAQERHRVLELGTSSGYQAALLAHLAGEVYSVEPNALVSERAATTLSLEGYERVHTRCGDPHQGWAEAGPFDRVLVCGAVAEVPPAVWDQLAPGGRIVAPLGLPGTRQWLTIVRKTVGGEREVEQVSPLSFSALPGGALAGSLPPPARPR